MMRHIAQPPVGIEWHECVHKETRQRYSVLEEDTAVETVHGTMTGRAGDYLVEGANGKVYVLTETSFWLVYNVPLSDGGVLTGA